MNSTYVEQKSSTQMGSIKRGVSIVDFMLRLIAIGATLGSAIAMIGFFVAIHLFIILILLSAPVLSRR